VYYGADEEARVVNDRVIIGGEEIEL